MLILTRKFGDSLVIGDNIKVTLIKGKGNQVKVAINAPKELDICREEIYKKKQGNT